MKKPNKEAVAFSRHINDWLTVYVPTVQSSSAHTVKNHHDALSLFLHFITQVKGLDARTFSFKLLERQVIEEWILWLKNDRKTLPKRATTALHPSGHLSNTYPRKMSAWHIWPASLLKYQDRGQSVRKSRDWVRMRWKHCWMHLIRILQLDAVISCFSYWCMALPHE